MARPIGCDRRRGHRRGGLSRPAEDGEDADGADRMLSLNVNETSDRVTPDLPGRNPDARGGDGSAT